MSVIFGIKENNRIIIAGDKRGSSIDGKTLSDDLDKVLMINDHLAFSSAGNAAIEKAISIDLNKATNKDCLTTDDLLDIIKAFYKRVADTNCDAILALPFYFLIAGKDNKFDGEESLYYVLVGNGGSSRLSKNEKYHIITCSAVAIYDINADCVVKKIKIMTWPISNQEYEAQNENSEYFNRFKDGVIYKVLGRLQYSTFGELAFLYVKEVLEENVSGTKLDKKQEKYLAPIVLEDDVLGKLVLEKSEGLFEGTYHFLGNDITIYIEVEWSSKATWKKPLAVARDFVEHIVSRDEAFREYIAADEALYDAALECLEDYEDECEIHFSTPEEFANALKERMKYIFVNQNGSYTIGYDDGYVFGGHEIDVDVDSKGKMVCADMR